MDRIPITAAALLGCAMAGMSPASAQVDGAPIHQWSQPSPQVIYMVGPLGIPQGYIWTAGGWYPVAAGTVHPARLVVPVMPVPSGAMRAEPEQHPGVVVPRSDVVMGWRGATTAGYATTHGGSRR